MAKNLRDLAIIPPETRERFLPLARTGLGSLRAAGVVLAGLSRFSEGYEILRPRPSNHLALYALEGSFLVDRGSGWETLEAPGLLRLPVGTYSHYRTADQPWRGVWFHLDELPVWEARGPAWTPGGSGARVEALVEGLLAESDGLDADAAEAAEGYSRLILLQLRRDLGAGSVNSGVLAFESLVAGIRDEVARDWSLAAMETYSGLSSRHLNRLFHERRGTTPQGFVAEVKMAHAQELIEHTPLGLSGVARAVGYENVFAFSTAFKRLRGRSPSSLRR